jgi:hypothetical protein
LIETAGTALAMCLNERELPHDHSRSDHRKNRYHQHVEQTRPLRLLIARGMAMKRSSALRIRRWAIEELIRRLDQQPDAAARAVLWSDGNSSASREKSSFRKNS